MLVILLAFVACLVAPSPSHALQSDHEVYLTQLIEQAQQKKLAEQREWQLLLHYRKGLLGGYESEQDDPGFFMSPNGKTDPSAELVATLAQFFSVELVGRSRQPAQCAFIARYHWLKEQLQFDPTRLPALSCERFDRWYEDFEVQSISLIFPSAFLNNPASMFGHTLFRVDQKGQTDQTRILAYTINYAADVPPNAGLAYPIRGIFGSYKGYFSTIPYYLKVQQYRDIENRDIWEYRLNLTENQLRRFLMHAWELGNAYFDYFFFKENCSYHILALLDYANPDLHLTDQFIGWTVPADTIRLVVSKPSLVSDITYRPSRSTVIKRKRESLPAEERDLAHRITEDLSEVASPIFTQLAPPKQAFVLDLASDYLRYRLETSDSPKPEWKDRNRTVLTTRSQLRIPSEEFTVRPFAKQPELGHKTSRAVIGGGWRNNDTFEEATIRGGYHDLLDPEVGYTPDAQIEMASITVRHYNRADQTRVERATLLNLLSLSPIDSVFHAPSWKLNLGMNTIRHNDCQLCSNGFLNGGIGGAKELRLLNREVLFAFAETEASVSKAYHELHRVGGGGTVGILADLTERWKIMATGSYLKFPLGDKSDDFRWYVGSRFTLARNWTVRLEYNHRDRDNDILFSLQAFF
ncbi:MAG: Lnb N-terminal periplasmic domain-containing protein [Nitrospira sp.]